MEEQKKENPTLSTRIQICSHGAKKRTDVSGTFGHKNHLMTLSAVLSSPEDDRAEKQFRLRLQCYSGLNSLPVSF